MTPRTQLWGSGLKFRMTPLKPKTDFESPYLILKRTSSNSISWVNIPLRCNYFKQKKLRNSNLHFRYQRCHWHRWNRFWRLLKRLSRRIRSHMRKGFSLLIRDLYGVDWWKNRESKISWHCPFKKLIKNLKWSILYNTVDHIYLVTMTEFNFWNWTSLCSNSYRIYIFIRKITSCINAYTYWQYPACKKSNVWRKDRLH
jgi:hypothetical protein